MAHEDYGPEEDCCGKVFANGEFDEANGTWEAGYKVAEVECAACPRIFLAYQVL